jgi:hypothetical protein
VARRIRASLAALLFTAAACSACRTDASAPGVADTATAADERITALPAELDVPTILAVLGQPHAQMRARVGPHRLDYTARFVLAPVEDPGRPRVGERVVRPQAVTDTLSLVFAGDDPLAFRLEQHNDADQGRSIVVLGERIYSQMRHRSWHVRDLDSQLHEQWLDDAHHAVADALAFAAPQLSIAVEDGDADTVHVVLSRADAPDPDAIVDEPSAAWRAQASLDRIDGELELDRPTASLRAARIEVDFSVPDPGGRPLRGELRLSATLAPASADALNVSAPEGALPLPERERYELERAELLDGLAAP